MRNKGQYSVTVYLPHHIYTFFINSDSLNSFNPGGPVLFTTLYMICKGIKPVVPRRCWKKFVMFLMVGSWLTFTMYLAVELLPIASAGSLYHAVWMVAAAVAARYVHSVCLSVCI